MFHKIIFNILPGFFAQAFAGIDLWSRRMSVLVATHYATLHRPTTTPNTKRYMQRHGSLLNIFSLIVKIFVKYYCFFVGALLVSIFSLVCPLSVSHLTLPHSIGPPPPPTRNNLCENTEVCLIYLIKGESICKK